MRFRLVSRREEVTTDEGRHLTGSGYVICDATTGARVGDDDFFFRIGGGIVCELAGAEHHIDELQSDTFAPGQPLALLRREGVVDVADEAGERIVGHLPPEAADVLGFSEADTYASALCLWEWRTESGRRFALRLLLAPGWKAEHLLPD